MLVDGDYFAKWTEAFPIDCHNCSCIGKMNSSLGLQHQLTSILNRTGALSLLKEICKLMGIVKTKTTPYHPHSDGGFNRTLNLMLRMVAVDGETNWDLRIPCLMHTPFSLKFGSELQLPIDVMYGLPAGTEHAVNVPLFVKDLRKWISEACKW